MNTDTKNMIPVLVPYYPENRDLSQCSREERIFNWVIKNSADFQKNNICCLKELVCIMNELLKCSKSLVIFPDRWTAYSALIIHYMSGLSGWRYTGEELREFLSEDVARLAFDNISAAGVFAFAEALAEVRSKASYKRTGNLYWGPRYGGTHDECESRLRTIAAGLDPEYHSCKEYKEYCNLLDRIFEDNEEQWRLLSHRGFESLKQILLNLPDRTIVYCNTLYTLKDITEYKEFAYREQIDDIEFDRFESGLNLILQKYNTCDVINLKIKDSYSDMSAGEIFKAHRLHFPGQDITDLLTELSL